MDSKRQGKSAALARDEENNLLWHPPFHLEREKRIDLFIGFD